MLKIINLESISKSQPWSYSSTKKNRYVYLLRYLISIPNGNPVANRKYRRESEAVTVLISVPLRSMAELR
jgi:hypothetical protein